MRERIREVLERFRLTDRSSDIVETLSGGMKRRLELAKALLHRPRLLLFDEPSTGLTPQRAGSSGSIWKPSTSRTALLCCSQPT